MTLRRISRKREEQLRKSGQWTGWSTFGRALERLKPKRRRDTGPARATRLVVWARCGGVCEFAGCLVPAVHVHHRRPRRVGGSRAAETNSDSNLVALCFGHHEWVEKNRTRAHQLGLLLHANEIPAEVPVMTRHDRLPVLLTDSGGWLWSLDGVRWAPG